MNNKNIVINPTTSGISVDLDFQLLSDHANLVKKYRENLKLPDRPLDLNILFNAKLVALLTEDDPMLSPIVKALQNKVEKINANSPYFKHFTRDLHESDGLLYMDGKLVIPFTLRNAMMKTLHETHPGQFGMKYLAQYIWWPHINRQIYFHGKNCSECTSADKGKSILSKERAKDWNADDRLEDGYKDDLIAKKNQNPTEKGYDTDYASSSKITANRLPIKSPFKGKILRKSNGNINRDCFYKELNKRIINSSTSTVKLSDGKIIRKFDIAIPIYTSNKISPFKGNISFPYFPNANVEVGQKQKGPSRKPRSRKPTRRTARQLNPTTSDNLTRTYVSGSSHKHTRRQTHHAKKSTTPPGYFASDESMIIPSDISDTSEWEWIAGGFPCRDVARERFISDLNTPHVSIKNNHNSAITRPEIKSEVLENYIDPNSEQPREQPYECPISIIPAGRTPSTEEQKTVTQGGDNDNSEHQNGQDECNPTDNNSVTDFPVYEINDSSDECTVLTDPTTKSGKITPTIRRSGRNVGPPKFNGKRYFIDAVDNIQETSGSATDPIVIEIEEPHTSDNKTTPAELISLDSSSSSSNQISTSSTDESLRMELENFGDHSDLDSELFNKELENFLNDYKSL